MKISYNDIITLDKIKAIYVRYMSGLIDKYNISENDQLFSDLCGLGMNFDDVIENLKKTHKQ